MSACICPKCKKKWMPLFNPDKEKAKKDLDYARSIGDTTGIMIAMACLSIEPTCPKCKEEKKSA